MVKMTYVPNTIRTPTHGVDFSHDLGRELKIANGAAVRSVEEKEEKKKERMQKEKGRKAIFYR
jgi:hypothetical protein